MSATESAFVGAERYQPTAIGERRGAVLPLRFGDAAREYRAATTGAVLFDRSDRGLVIVRGKDRKSWLHNLVTNAVKTLDDNAGNYAFAIDVRGRTHFDLNILALADEVWLDVQMDALRGALAHFNKFLIMEDATLADATTRFARLGVSGPDAARVAAALGSVQLAAMPSLGGFWLDGGVRLIRHDFAGSTGFELYVPRGEARAWWDRIASIAGVTCAGDDVLDVLRVEAGIPWLGRDIDEKVIPPETGQVERGISYHKGCYLGQEVIERMRSHGSLAKRLVKLRVTDGASVALPAVIRKEGAEVGRVTSLVRHPLQSSWIGLGYLRSAVKDGTGLTVADIALELV